MPKTDKNYTKEVLEYCDKEADLLALFTSSVMSQHAQELAMVESVASQTEKAAEDDNSKKGRMAKRNANSLRDSYRDNLTVELYGATQMFLVLAELYRVMVDEGKIEHINLPVVANKIGMSPKAVKVMMKLAMSQDDGMGLDKVIDFNELSFENLNNPKKEGIDVGHDIDKDVDEDVAQLFNDVMEEMSDD